MTDDYVEFFEVDNPDPWGGREVYRSGSKDGYPYVVPVIGDRRFVVDLREDRPKDNSGVYEVVDTKDVGGLLRERALKARIVDDDEMIRMVRGGSN